MLLIIIQIKRAFALKTGLKLQQTNSFYRFLLCLFLTAKLNREDTKDAFYKYRQ